MNYQTNQITPKRVSAWIAISFASLVALVGFILLLVLVINAFSRWQARANAHNQVSVTHILIQQAQQQAQINNAQIAATVAEAKKIYQESIGVRRAQDEISKTLTPLYIQYEAIKAEEAIATSGRNNTIIYVPASQGGVPVITNTGAGK